MEIVSMGQYWVIVVFTLALLLLQCDTMRYGTLAAVFSLYHGY